MRGQARYVCALVITMALPDLCRADDPLEYVFIDESHRDSKRLKITRACESCRRRKVRLSSRMLSSLLML